MKIAATLLISTCTPASLSAVDAVIRRGETGVARNLNTRRQLPGKSKTGGDSGKSTGKGKGKGWGGSKKSSKGSRSSDDEGPCECDGYTQYVVNPQPASWPTANWEARANFGCELASITSNETLAEALAVLESEGVIGAWIGLARSVADSTGPNATSTTAAGGWFWTDGSSYDYENFANGNPEESDLYVALSDIRSGRSPAASGEWLSFAPGQRVLFSSLMKCCLPAGCEVKQWPMYLNGGADD